MEKAKKTERSVLSLSRLRRSVRLMLDWLKLVESVARDRRALRSMSDRELSDIGLTAEDVRSEVRRPWWDAPLR